MNFGVFTLVGIIMLVLSGASFGYLVQVKNKGRSSFLLQWFFLCIIFSSIATILTNSGFVWSRALAPSQDAALILGGVFLLGFAYVFPKNDQPLEARIVITVFTFLVLAVIAYSILFAALFIYNLPAPVEENRSIYLLTPLAVLFGVIIFFRRSLHWSLLLSDGGEKHKKSIRWSVANLLKPGSMVALALRNFGAALSLGLIPVTIIILKPVLPPLFSSFLFNFGVVIAISAVMLVYLNHAPEASTLTAKLVGISLVTVLLIFGFASVWFLMSTPSELTQDVVVKFMILIPVCSLLIILLFPLFFRPNLLQPLRRLLEGVGEVNRGNLGVQVDVRYDDEVGFLTSSFNRMVLSLRSAKGDLDNAALSLESQVKERTQALKVTNDKLMSEIQDRIEIQRTLDRQLAYEQALADCSSMLLLPVEEVLQPETRQTDPRLAGTRLAGTRLAGTRLAGTRKQVLTQAIEHLRTAADASRAYIFVNFEDAKLGLCIGMVAESCSPGIPAQIDNPINQKFPWTQLPVDMMKSLEAAQPYGGLTEVVLSSTPDLLNNFLQQEFPIRSIELLPIFLGNDWWGFIGFDDCTKPREWKPQEIGMLQTAAEMVGNTVKRWNVEDDLRDILQQLEYRVKERTIQYAQTNQELRHEIHERQRFQDELLERLKVEKTLARISARLLTPLNPEIAIQETIQEISEMVRAQDVVFFQHPSNPAMPIPSVIDKNLVRKDDQQSHPDFTRMDHLSSHVEAQPKMFNCLDGDYAWIYQQLLNCQVVLVSELSALPEDAAAERKMMLKNAVTSMLVIPLFIDDELSAVVMLFNLEFPKPDFAEHIQSLEVVADMLSGFLHRVSLLNMLEEKVAERTRELATFFDMTMLVGEARELADVMQPALVKIIEIISCDAAHIYIYHEDQRTLSLVSHLGFRQEQSVHLESIQADTAINNWIQNLDVLESLESDFNVETPEMFLFSEFPSMIHLALRTRGKVQGLLSCYRNQASSFDPYRVNFLTIIGEQLGMAVESYRLRLKAEDIATYQERQRLARELHDAVSQSLYGLVLYARSGRDAFEAGDNKKLADSLAQVELNSQAALKEMRLLLYQLRSWSLEPGGMVKALKSRFDMVERRSGIKVEFSIDETIHVPVQAEQELFWIVTEALNNSLKHSGASHISVTMVQENDLIILKVEDNGKGFDNSQVSLGMGIQNMRERALILGGRFDLVSNAGQGTCIRLEIPREVLSTGDRNNE